MAHAGFLGISLLAYASWQTIHFLNDRSPRVWARQKFHRYFPRPTTQSLKAGKSCGNCIHYQSHPDFKRSGLCGNDEWKIAMSSDEVMVKREGCCELWRKTFPLPAVDTELSPDPLPAFES